MTKLKFYDFGAKQSFTTSKYKIVMKKGRKYAVADAPSGSKSWRAVKK